jgi:hypothetical protein
LVKMILQDNLNLAQFISDRADGVPKDVAAAIKNKAKEDRKVRKVDPVKHWEMYKGEHAYYFKQRNKEDNELFVYRKKMAVIANYVRYVVDLNAKYLYGRASKVSRRFGKNDTTDKRIRKNLERCQYDMLMLEAARKAGLFAEMPFRIVAIDEKTKDQPKGPATESTYGHPVILDPTKTFFLMNEWGKIRGVVIENLVKDYVTGVNKDTRELIVGDSRWFWVDDVLQSAEVNNYELEEEFVLCKNNDMWTDDVQDIVDLNITLDEALTDNAHFFAKHGWPQLISSVDLSTVAAAPGHVWQIESDGPQDKVADKVHYITWDGRMEDAKNFLQMIEAMIFKISGTARIATGDLEAIGQLRSGPAIVTAHSPSIQKTQEKQVIWGSNEQKLIFAMAAFDAKIHGESVEARYPELDVDILYPRDFVPGEELVRAEVQQININSHIRTFEDIIRENHPEFNDEQVEEYRSQLMKDGEDVVDSLREFVSKTEGGEAMKPKVAKPSGQSSSATSKSKEQS